MKAKKLKLIYIASLLCFASISVTNHDVNAAVYSDVPTVKYDDVATYSEQYYSSLTGKASTSLLNDLATLCQDKHRYYTSYGELRGGNAISDADPNDPENYLIDFYTGWSVSNEWNSGSNWNREHVWAQSLSGNLFGTGTGAGSDIHHIRPLISNVNSARGNAKYADLENVSGAEKYYYNNKDTGCYRVGQTYFEPRDEAKGDIARILLYLYTHYSKQVSANSSFTYAGNLYISNIIYTSLNTDQAAFDLLIEWNKLDPVDEFEKNRNDYCSSVTGLRNPYIDHPEFVTMIWDKSYSGSGALLDKDNQEDTSYLKLKEYEKEMLVNQTYQILAYTNIENPTYTYISSNPSVASVSSNGLVSAISKGTSNIEVKCGHRRASFYIEVKEKTVANVGGYEKVTSTLSDYTGKYLIVFENSLTSGYLFNGVDGVNGYVESTIENGIIYSNNDVDAQAVEISKSGSGYSIKHANGYISGKSNSNALTFSSSPSECSITYESNSSKIVSNTSVLRFNATANQLRFRFYKSSTYTGQKEVQLYKYSDKIESSETEENLGFNGKNYVSLSYTTTYENQELLNVSNPKLTYITKFKQEDLLDGSIDPNLLTYKAKVSYGSSNEIIDVNLRNENDMFILSCSFTNIPESVSYYVIYNNEQYYCDVIEVSLLEVLDLYISNPFLIDTKNINKVINELNHLKETLK